VFPAIRHYRSRQWHGVSHEPLRLPGEERLSPERLEELLQPHQKALAQRPLYVSLDKDVMGTADAVVNWDSGHLRLSEVRDVLSAFVRAAGGNLAGMDVVGDWSPVTVRGWFRRWLHYTEHPLLRVAPHEALTINDHTNQMLLDTLGSLGVYHAAISRRAAS
jgi:hypothetical protein